MTIVTTLHKPQSKYDFVHKGIPMQFKVKPCTDGVSVAFVRDLRLRDIMPEEMISIFAIGNDPDKIVRKHSVVEDHITVRWWEKLFGFTLEKKVERWANTVRKDYQNSEVIAEQIRAFVSE